MFRFSEQEIRKRINYRALRWVPPTGRLLLKALTWDRKESTFEEVRKSILRGDLRLAIRLFSVAPNVDWIEYVLGSEAKNVWRRVKPYLKPSTDPLSLYRQCEVFLERK